MARPRSAVVMFDFDGTLSDVVVDPAAARPRPGVVDHLAALASLYGRVAVISGRPVGFLAAHLPADLQLSGLYGMEERVDGETSTPAEHLRWSEAVGAAVEELSAALSDEVVSSGVEVEDKGLSVTVHFRRRPDAETMVMELAHRVAGRRGLDVRPARMSVEVHPPVPTDKGRVVKKLVEGLSGAEAAMFVGDDVGDLPAFDALAEMRASGLTTVAVAVASSEMDPRMAERSDLVIEAPQVEALLRTLRFGAGTDG